MAERGGSDVCTTRLRATVVDCQDYFERCRGANGRARLEVGGFASGYCMEHAANCRSKKLLLRWSPGLLFRRAAIRILASCEAGETFLIPSVTTTLSKENTHREFGMASDLLHIKDSYYFDVPRMLWRARYESSKDLAEGVGHWYVRLDPDYQDWEADRFIAKLATISPDIGKNAGVLKHDWLHWQHADHTRHGRPFDQYVEDEYAAIMGRAQVWAKRNAPEASDPVSAYLAENLSAEPAAWVVELHRSPEQLTRWQAERSVMDSGEVLMQDYIASARGKWSQQKISDYNRSLSGKVFIPQPFGSLRNAYESQSGFAISKYMLIEVVVAVLLILAFRWLAGRVQSGAAPKGKPWNFLEGFLTFIRNEVVVKGMGEHDADKFMPLMWTIFMYILGCNLMGMLPWVGAPSAAFGTTCVLALIIFAVGTFMGIKTFGVLGYLKNLCPDLGLPWYMAIVIVPMVWSIEFVSVFIKHGVLAIRLFANMVAGHLVLLGIMGLAFGVQAVTMHVGAWSLLSVVAILGTTALSLLELMVAFLQAYVFTLLSALFIGSSMHHH